MYKKKIIGAAILILAVLALAYWVKYSSYSPTSYRMDGEGFSAEVKNGGELILDLPSNATTGYRWVIVEESDIFTSDYDSYTADENKEGLVGAGGTTQFHMIALNNGSGTMVLQYKQDWEGGNVGGTYELRLDISRHHKIHLQIDTVSFARVD